LRKLYLLRHAKSAWDREGLDDHDRPLAPRGKRAARALAGHCREAHIAPDLVLCSTSVRTRETLDLVLQGFRRSPLVVMEQTLYLASSGAILKRLQDVEDKVKQVMVIGHNPGMHEAALALAQRGARDLQEALATKFPTGALATFEIDGTWHKLTPSSAKLAAFLVPADLAVS
jgi:phosphohistidine phosphatase